MEFIMLRGCQKRVYHIRNPHSAYFEEAYLVLRPNAPQSVSASPSLAAEADRIIREACGVCRPERMHAPLVGRGLAFALGAASSSALIGTIALLITMV